MGRDVLERLCTQGGGGVPGRVPTLHGTELLVATHFPQRGIPGDPQLYVMVSPWHNRSSSLGKRSQMIQDMQQAY